ncbi:MAG: hypothetical protein O7G87_00785 [bacterium]|nr:hypothetical protein [bacterium]
MLKRFVFFLLVFLVATVVEAQPPRGGGRGGPGGGRGGRGGAAFLVNRMVPIEQVMGYLAFDDKIALKDDQLLKIRQALKELNGKRDGLRQELQGQGEGGDMQAARQKVMILARQMNQAVAGVLDAKQTEEYKGYMKRMQERAQRGGGGRGGQGGRRRGQGGGGGGA